MTANVEGPPAVAEMTAGLQRLGLIGPVAPQYEPLSGGVSSDIFRVWTPARTFVVKRALARLKVASEWRVPIERNSYEYRWLQIVGQILPQSVPRLFGHDPVAQLFAMEFFDLRRNPVWKSELRSGGSEVVFAAEVGRRLVTIHAATAGDQKLAQGFATDAVFKLIRIYPYLMTLAGKYPNLGESLGKLAKQTLAIKSVLVHGDISPKNILCGANGPIFLDAECAWFGDPAFDLAFCLNHLLLKCLWNRSASEKYLACFTALAESYLAGVQWESAEHLESRAAALLPALMLARIDGKSPVEYIADDYDRTLVRTFAIPLILRPPQRLDRFPRKWSAACAGF
jgi:aminoglycoside phosphotransferase (APT) family kinase protein